MVENCNYKDQKNTIKIGRKIRKSDTKMISYNVHSWSQLNVRNDNDPRYKGMKSSKINDLSVQRQLLLTIQ